MKSLLSAHSMEHRLHLMQRCGTVCCALPDQQVAAAKPLPSLTMCQAGSQEASPSRPASVPGSFPQVQSMPGPEVLHILRDPAAYQRLAQDILQASSSYQVCPAWTSMAAGVNKPRVLSVVHFVRDLQSPHRVPKESCHACQDVGVSCCGGPPMAMSSWRQPA